MQLFSFVLAGQSFSGGRIDRVPAFNQPEQQGVAAQFSSSSIKASAPTNWQPSGPFLTVSFTNSSVEGAYLILPLFSFPINRHCRYKYI
jgi:hypothetical protein